MARTDRLWKNQRLLATKNRPLVPINRSAPTASTTRAPDGRNSVNRTDDAPRSCHPWQRQTKPIAPPASFTGSCPFSVPQPRVPAAGSTRDKNKPLTTPTRTPRPRMHIIRTYVRSFSKRFLGQEVSSYAAHRHGCTRFFSTSSLTQKPSVTTHVVASTNAPSRYALSLQKASSQAANCQEEYERSFPETFSRSRGNSHAGRRHGYGAFLRHKFSRLRGTNHAAYRASRSKGSSYAALRHGAGTPQTMVACMHAQ